jgi:4-hydroxy-tetrahydrodipicolinate reductase
MKKKTITKVVVIGAAGRMGQTLVRCIRRMPEIQLVGAVERAGHLAVSADAGVVAGVGETGVIITSHLAEVATEADVLIDFSMHTAVSAHARLACDRGVNLVVGTTGLYDAEKAVLLEVAKCVAVVWAPNMSAGMNLLFALVNKAAAVLGPKYDVEIIEIHHRFKKDAPSGTALHLGERIAAGRKQDFKQIATFGRKGIAEGRPEGQIGIHAVRAGDVVGDHTVVFAIEGERLEFVHRATNREAFAMGALRAAQWVNGRKPGLYDMQDVLSL